MNKSSPQPAQQVSANKAELGATKEVELSRINAQITSEEHLKLSFIVLKTELPSQN